MADWDNITNRDDSSTMMSRDSLTNILGRDLKISVMEPVNEFFIDSNEPISIKPVSSSVIIPAEDRNICREHYEPMKHQLRQSTRRHSVSETKFKERHPCASSTPGKPRASLSAEVGSSYSSSPRTPDSAMRKSFEFPSTPIRLRASSYSTGGRRKSMGNLSLRFDDVYENSKTNFSLSPRALRSPKYSASYKNRILNDTSVKLDDITEGSNKIFQNRRNSLESSTYSTPKRKRTMSNSALMLENLDEEFSSFKWDKLSSDKRSGLSPAKELRSRRRRLDSLHLDPPRLSSNSLPQDDHDSFHFRDIFHIRDVFHLHERLRALEWRTYLPTNYFSMTPHMHRYNRRRSDESYCEEHSMLDDTVIEGQELYLHFFHEQLRKAGIENQIAATQEEGLASYHASCTHAHEPDMELVAISNNRKSRKMSLNLENFQNPIWRQTGRDLKILADQFANSVERIRVQERAEQVNIESLNREEFFSMLTELFQGGRVTRERILVLFFFCSDVAIRAIKSNSEGLLSTLTQWSLLFIKDQVCAWVGKNGGWQVVLRSGFNMLQQTIFVGACAAVIICSIVYIRKNISTNSGT